MSSSYQPPSNKHWHGRSSEVHEYWYQQINFLDLFKETDIACDIAFIGYQCEEGIKRNQGRPGAKAGPNAIREQLGKLPIHRDDLVLSDCGDLVYGGNVELQTFQLQFAGHISRLIRSGVFPIALGGGHDISFAHFSGIHEALYEEELKFGIVNFDAHFDLRNEDSSTSGTPFKQILDQFGDHTSYAALGIQQSSNTKELFGIAKNTGTRFIPLEKCNSTNIEESYDLLNAIAADVDYIYITVDMDGFSSAFSPGVSAPSPAGLTPDFVQHTLRHLIKTKKVVAIDFAETNPAYDQDHATARLASKLIWEVVQSI